MTCKIKICGLTNRADIDLVAQAGADFGGLLVEIASPRGVTLDKAKELAHDRPLPIVAVTMDDPVERIAAIELALKPAALQLHGRETPQTVASLKRHVECEVWKVVHMPASDSGQEPDPERFIEVARPYIDAGADRILVDAKAVAAGEVRYGGTGQTVNWWTARVLREKLGVPMILAGGITPANAIDAVTAVNPYAIDLSSGVEREKGVKDPDKVRQLIELVKALETAYE